MSLYIDGVPIGTFYTQSIPPAPGHASEANTLEEVGRLIYQVGEVPVRPFGTRMTETPFHGGTLFNNLPLNIYVEGRWYEGQKELLAPNWADGSIPKPVPEILALPTVALGTPPPAQSSWLKYAAVGAAAYFLLRR